jgi:hypothetical protein
MELIDRYVYAVTKRLPADQRADIEKELRGLIEDMLAEVKETEAKGDAAVESVLKKLGHPVILAASYRGVDQHLIGPGLFYLYSLVLKIVLIATGGGLMIALIVNLLSNGSSNPLLTVLEAFGSILTGMIGAFGWVTLIFAAIERYSPEHIDMNKEEIFQPRDLPQVPKEKERIHPADPIATMVFTLVAMVLAYYVPRFVGFYPGAFLAGGFIPLFNETIYMMYLPFIVIVLAFALLREIGKLVTGRWTIPMSIFYLIIGIPNLVLTVVMFQNPDIFNGEFFNRILGLTHSVDPMALGLPLPQLISRIIIGIAAFGFIVDTITTAARVIRRAINT